MPSVLPRLDPLLSPNALALPVDAGPMFCTCRRCTCCGRGPTCRTCCCSTSRCPTRRATRSPPRPRSAAAARMCGLLMGPLGATRPPRRARRRRCTHVRLVDGRPLDGDDVPAPRTPRLERKACAAVSCGAARLLRAQQLPHPAPLAAEARGPASRA